MSHKLIIFFYFLPNFQLGPVVGFQLVAVKLFLAHFTPPPKKSKSGTLGLQTVKLREKTGYKVESRKEKKLNGIE